MSQITWLSQSRAGWGENTGRTSLLCRDLDCVPAIGLNQRRDAQDTEPLQGGRGGSTDPPSNPTPQGLEGTAAVTSSPLSADSQNIAPNVAPHLFLVMRNAMKYCGLPREKKQKKRTTAHVQTPLLESGY